MLCKRQHFGGRNGPKKLKRFNDGFSVFSKRQKRHVFPSTQKTHFRKEVADENLRDFFFLSSIFPSENRKYSAAASAARPNSRVIALCEPNCGMACASPIPRQQNDGACRCHIGKGDVILLQEGKKRVAQFFLQRSKNEIYFFMAASM